MIYFTSDLHLGHARIIELCQRPFASAEEMDQALVTRWNAKVTSEHDIVYVLGDFAFKHAADRLDQLRGRKILITGNHDHRDQRRLRGWEAVHNYLYLEGQKSHFVLFHYPIEEWERQRHGAIHLHGHQHNKAPVTGKRRIDVGVDGNEFSPWSIDEIEKLVGEP